MRNLVRWASAAAVAVLFASVSVNARGNGVCVRDTGNGLRKLDVPLVAQAECPIVVESDNRLLDGVLDTVQPQILQSTGDRAQRTTRTAVGVKALEGTDPVQANGEFVHSETDLSLPGRGVPFVFERTYRSRVRAFGALGWSWTHSYDRRLYIVREGTCSTRIDYHDGHLGVVSFHETSRDLSRVTFAPPAGEGLTLVFDVGANEYVVRDGSRIDQVFAGSEMATPLKTPSSANWRPLSALRDPMGNEITFLWADGSDGFAHPRVLSAVDTVGRTIGFQYTQVDPHPGFYDKPRYDYFLQCITLDGSSDCTSAPFNYGYQKEPALDGYGDLTSVVDDAGVGFTYAYDEILAKEKDWRGHMGTDEVLDSCQRVCGKPATNCHNIDLCGEKSTGCQTQADSDEEGCRVACAFGFPDPICLGICKAHAQDELDKCNAAFQQEYPYCAKSGDACVHACVQHATARDPDDPSMDKAIYQYGAKRDGNHNLTEIADQAGRRILRNVYGGTVLDLTTRLLVDYDPTNVNFDRVVEQWLGARPPNGVEDKARHVQLNYFDLKREQQFLDQQRSLMVAGLKITHDPSPISDNDRVFVKLPSAFRSVDVCPRGPFALTLCPQPATTTSSAGAPQLPVFAAVVTDIHGVTRTTYLDDKMRTLREQVFDAHDFGGTFIYPRETTDYNYREHDGGVDTIVRHPAGDRTYVATGAFNLETARARLPAPGAQGDTRTKVVGSEYDARGQLLSRSVWSDLGEAHTLFTIVRDEKERVTTITTYLANAVSQTLVTTYGYANGSLWDSPNTITAPDQSQTSFDRFNAAAGGPEIVTHDALGAAPMIETTDHDALGRATTHTTQVGIVPLRSETLSYQGSSGRVTRKLEQDLLQSPPTFHLGRTTFYAYQPGFSSPSTVITPERTDYIVVDESGQTQQIRSVPSDALSPGHEPRLHCFDRAPDGRLRAEMFPEGNVKRYRYDVVGRLKAVDMGYPATVPAWAANCVGNLEPGTNAPSKPRVTQTVLLRDYRVGGSLRFEHDGMGVGLEYVTDGRGRVIRAKDANGNEHWTGYDLLDHVIWEADYGPNAPATYAFPTSPYGSLATMSEYSYDLTGRQRSRTRWKFTPGNVDVTMQKIISTTAYDDRTNTQTATSEGGLVTITQRDGLGRTTRHETVGLSVNLASHMPDNTIVLTLPSPTGVGVVTQTMELDSWQNPHRGWLGAIGTGELLFTRDRDKLGRVVHESGRRNSSSRWLHYTAFSQVDTVTRDTSASSSTTSSTVTTYDGNGRRARFSDGDTKATIFGYDGQDRMVSVTDGALRTTTTDYVLGSMRTLHVYAPGGTTTTNWYSGGLVRRQDIVNGAGLANAGRTLVRTFGYDPLGRITSATIDGNFAFPTRNTTVTRAFDSLGTMTLEREASSPFDVTHEFDPEARTETTTWGAAQITRTLDRLGRMSAVALGGTSIATYGYAQGERGPASVTLGNGLSTTITSDSFGLPTDAVTKGANGASVVESHVGFGADGTPRSRRSVWAGIGSRAELFTVDAAGRVTGEGLGYSGALPSFPSPVANADVLATLAASPVTGDYSLDGADNWLTRTRTDLGGAASFVTDGSNAYSSVAGASIGYDALGQTTSYPANAPTETYSFDGTGALISAMSNGVTSTYAYDALGRRIYEVTGGATRHYVWDGTRPFAIGTDKSSASSYQLLVGDGARVQARVSSAGAGDRVFLHAAWDGSVIAVTDASAKLVEAYAYSAYGDTTVLGPDGATRDDSLIGNRILFQGQLYDRAHRVYWMGARVYKPTWGRFLTQDPIGTGGGQNVYAFVNARPLAFVDSTGLDAKPPQSGPVASDDGEPIVLASADDTLPVGMFDAPSPATGSNPFRLTLGDFASQLKVGRLESGLESVDPIGFVLGFAFAFERKLGKLAFHSVEFVAHLDVDKLIDGMWEHSNASVLDAYARWAYRTEDWFHYRDDQPTPLESYMRSWNYTNGGRYGISETSGVEREYPPWILRTSAPLGPGGEPAGAGVWEPAALHEFRDWVERPYAP